VSDRALRAALLEAADSWDQCFACAPGQRGARVYVPGRPPDPHYVKQDNEEATSFARQQVPAAVGLAACRTALARLNYLDKP
jgi:hypothetical protein